MEKSKIIIKHIKVSNIITKSNLPVCDFSVNPYVGCQHGCKYCYACFMRRFTKHTEPWGTFVDIKTWEPISNSKKYDGKELFIGSVTDPYQPLEATYKRTHDLLKQLCGSNAKLSIATKSDLILRDLDLIKSFNDARVSWSINTLDESFCLDMDHAVSIKKRLEAMKIFYDSKIRTTCFISPIFPGITDVKAIINQVKDKCNLIWLENLNLRGPFKAQIMDYIANKYPHLLPLYQKIYNENNKEYWINLDQELKAFASSIGLEYVTNDDTIKRPFDAPPVIVNYFYHSEIKKNGKKER